PADVPNAGEHTRPAADAVHAVTIESDSRLAALLGAGTAEVNLAAFRAGMEAPPATLQSAIGSPDAPPQAQVDVNTTWCKGCDICSRVCPEYCLAVDGDGIVTVVRPDACTGCRLCELLCPDFAITVARAPATAPAGDLG
ncbi:MAG: 4Fe-4S binding protein, partial [Acidimicrobiia bacterium]